MSEVLIHVMRGEYVESRHHGDLAIVDRNGKLYYSIGNPQRFTFWRSSAKPFQTIPFVEEGGIEKYQIAGEELSLMTASHGGEEGHVKILRELLAKINHTEEKLDCGIAAPMYGKAAANILRSGNSYKAVNNPCSGKHAAMLALAELLDLPIEDYILLNHPIQQKMLEVIADICDLPKGEVKIAIDGCGVPVFGMGIDKMALAYGKFSKPEGVFPDKRAQALRRILHAMTHYPYYVAGTNRLDTVLMEATKGRIVAKLGAEAVYCIGIVDEGLGICLKIDDGSYRAIDPVIIQVLKELGFITNEELKQLSMYWKPKLYNHRNDVIGELETVFKLKKHD